MANRALLHITKLDAFVLWMLDQGWERAEAKGPYEVARLTIANEAPIIIFRRGKTIQHYTLQQKGVYYFRKWKHEQAARGQV